jgi:O-antigen ligase
LKVLETLKGHVLYPPMLFLAMEAAGDRRKMRQFALLVLGLTGFVAAGAVVQSFVPIDLLLRTGLSVETGSVVFIAIDPISGKIYQRLFSVLDDQSSVAAFSFLGIVLAVYLLTSAKKARHRVPILALLGINAYALILTYNMTTLSGVILFFVLLIARMRSVRLLTWFLLVTLLVSGVAWARYGEFIRNRLVTSFTLKEGVSTSLYIRVASNKRAIRMAQQNPILGQGLGATANAYVYYRLGMRRSIEGGFAVDNFYMTTLLESGIIGLGALLMMHSLPILGFWALRRNSSDPDDRALSVVGGTAVIVFLLMNFSNGQMNTNPTNLVFWSMTGAVWRRAWDSRPGRVLSPASSRPTGAGFA